MIYITGDTHGNLVRRLQTESFPEQQDMTKNDFVIISGDFGGIWSQGNESMDEAALLDWLESRPFSLLFIDGNHENFDRLYSYPVKNWNGGRVHEIRPHVLHLMRGQIFQIDGKKIFTFGGARSHDIEDRTENLTWWPQELASQEEMEEGRRNLESCDYTVDYIVTHCCSTSTQDEIGGGLYEPDTETEFLEYIKNNVDYKKWFFGHYHENWNVNDQEILLYEEIVRII